MVFERLHAAFQRAASSVPAYRRLLQEHDVDASAIVDCETFAARCPILTKANTFDRFAIEQLCAEGAMAMSSRTLVVATVAVADENPTPIGRQLMTSVRRCEIENASSRA